MCYNSVRSNICCKMKTKKKKKCLHAGSCKRFAHLFIAECCFKVKIPTLHIALLAILLLVGIPSSAANSCSPSQFPLPVTVQLK